MLASGRPPRLSGGSVCYQVIGEPIKQSTKMIGEPIKRTVKPALRIKLLGDLLCREPPARQAED